MKRRFGVALLIAIAASVLFAPAAALAASGNDVGHNIGSTLRHYAGWLVFSPDQVAEAARAIGQRILP